MYNDLPFDAQSGVIFLHLPKTAGSTINAILAKQYPRRQIHVINPVRPGQSEDRFRHMSEAKRARIRLLRGHFQYGMHRWMPRDCVYFTFFRDPVARAMSVYRYVIQNPIHPRYALGKGLAPEHFLADARLHPPDGQTRSIAGPRVAEADLLEVAKENLEQHFIVAGLAERFDESLLMLQRALGWQDVRYHPRNTSRKAAPAGQTPRGPPQAVIDLVHENEPRDVELYEWVSKRFDAAVASFGAPFQQELGAFRAANAANTAFHDRFEPIVQRGESVARRILFRMRQLKP